MVNHYFQIGAREYERRTPWVSDLQLREIIETAIEFKVHDAPCLELASGSARLARRAQERGQGRWIALDIEMKMLPSHDPALSRVVADGAMLPFRNEVFGAVATWSGLHYIGADRGLSEMFRVLQPGGVAVAAQKIADALSEHLDWYREVQRLRSTAQREWYFSDDLAHRGLAAGFTVAGVIRYRQWHRLRAVDWASRDGYFEHDLTQQLLSLAARGKDQLFTQATGFRYDGEFVEYPIDWAIVRWQKPEAR